MYVDENLSGQYWNYYTDGGYDNDYAVSATEQYRPYYSWGVAGATYPPYQEVFVTWVPDDDRGTAVPYNVHHAEGQSDAITVNQQVEPAGSVPDDPLKWQSLGVYEAAESVEVNGHNSSPYPRTCVDAVLLRGVDPICDLLTDSNNDGSINADDDPIEGDPTGSMSAGTGRIVAIGSSTRTEVKLHAAAVDAALSGPQDWWAQLRFPSGLKVWENPVGAPELTTNTTWEITANGPWDTSVWIEGVTAGTASLQLELFSRPGDPEEERLYSWKESVKVTVVDPPTINIVPVDPDAKELSPNELLCDDPAMFLLTRTGSLVNDITVHLQYSGTADPEDYYVNGAIGSESVVIPAGRSDVAVTLQALHDDMTADPDYDPETAIVDLVAPPDGSCVVGQFSSQTSYVYDTSDWKAVAENPQRKPFPDEYLRYHPAPPTSGSFYTVVIVMGGALDGGGNERELWARRTYDAFPGAYVYNDLKNVDDVANVLLSFPVDSITRLVFGGHCAKGDRRLGVYPTNGNTEVPPGYADVDDDAIKNLPPGTINEIKDRLEASAIIDVQACGYSGNTVGAISLYETLNRQVRYVSGKIKGWNQKPTPGDSGLGGKWEWYPPL